MSDKYIYASNNALTPAEIDNVFPRMFLNGENLNLVDGLHEITTYLRNELDSEKHIYFVELCTIFDLPDMYRFGLERDIVNQVYVNSIKKIKKITHLDLVTSDDEVSDKYMKVDRHCIYFHDYTECALIDGDSSLITDEDNVDKSLIDVETVTYENKKNTEKTRAAKEMLQIITEKTSKIESLAEDIKKCNSDQKKMKIQIHVNTLLNSVLFGLCCYKFSKLKSLGENKK